MPVLSYHSDLLGSMDHMIHLCFINMDHSSSGIKSFTCIGIRPRRTLGCVHSITVSCSHIMYLINCLDLLWHWPIELWVGCVRCCNQIPLLYSQGQIEIFCIEHIWQVLCLWFGIQGRSSGNATLLLRAGMVFLFFCWHISVHLLHFGCATVWE